MTCKGQIDRHILRYIEMVETGEVRACKDQHLLVAYIRRCFETEDIFTDTDQLEHYLGLVKYFPFRELFPWQEFVIALHDCTYWRDSGLPRWPDLLCMVARGSGKDGLIAVEGGCLISPYNPIAKYDVDICGNVEEQATRPLDDFREALEDPAQSRKLRRHFYWNLEKIVGLKNRSTMRGRTNNPKSRDGMRSGIVVFNEVHQYENYANINVFTTGLGKKPHPRRSYYTTNGNVREGVLDDLLETAGAILTGGEADGGLLPFLCRLNDPEEVHDPENWVMACPSLPYMPNLMEETRKEYQEWKARPNQLPDFMAKRMNLPQSDREVQVTDWANIIATNKPVVDLEGWDCTVGIDYTKTTDMASVMFHFRDRDTRYDIHHSWLCLKSADLPRIRAPWRTWADEGIITPVDDVEIHPDMIAAYIEALGRRHNICGLAVDNFRYSLLANSLRNIGFDPKDKGDRGIKLVRPSDIMMVVPVIDSCFAKRGFVWGDDPVLRWAANNTKLIRAGKRVGNDTGNFVYGKIEGRSRKTDPFMALAHAMTLEGRLEDGGPPARIRPSGGVLVY